MRQVHIRVDDELYNELNLYSEKNELSMQDCVREAVAYYMSDVKKKKNTGKEKKFTFIDLFAGIGGMRIAFDRAGGQCVYSSEWNKYSQQTYFANFGEQPEGDITKVNAADIPDSRTGGRCHNAKLLNIKGNGPLILLCKHTHFLQLLLQSLKLFI